MGGFCYTEPAKIQLIFEPRIFGLRLPPQDKRRAPKKQKVRFAPAGRGGANRKS
jgi:hypothetical protein